MARLFTSDGNRCLIYELAEWQHKRFDSLSSFQTITTAKSCMDGDDMVSSYIKEHAAYQYAVRVSERQIIAGKYVIKACENFLFELHNEDSKYFIDEAEMKKITNLTKLINMATGLKAGTPLMMLLLHFSGSLLLMRFVGNIKTHHKNEDLRSQFF